MEKTDAASRPCRRVGTFTFGMVLVVSGLAMLVSMFFPQLEFTWLLQLSPLALISLGVETLLAARGSERVKYDWVGMLLCFLIVCASLVLFAAAWWLAHCPDSVFY